MFLFYVPIRYLGNFKTIFPSIIMLAFNYTYNVQFPILLLFVVALIISLPLKIIIWSNFGNFNITVSYQKSTLTNLNTWTISIF